MTKLMIVDDETDVREAIAALIDWDSLGVSLIGSCGNGIEAYEMILDESPDIVLTDIRMPGLSGIELIEKASTASPSTRFIILSGFGEFELAKEAMKYGVRHYLLKPIREEQIIESVQALIGEMKKTQSLSLPVSPAERTQNHISLHSIFGILNDILYHNRPIDEEIPAYEPYLDFSAEPYRLIYLHFLEPSSLDEINRCLDLYLSKRSVQTLYRIYVTNTLLLFYPSRSIQQEEFVEFLRSLKAEGQTVDLEIRAENFDSLKSLLLRISEKISRYHTISFCINGLFFPLYNYSYISTESDRILDDLREGGHSVHTFLQEFLSEMTDVSTAKICLLSLLLKYHAEYADSRQIGMSEKMQLIHNADSLEDLKTISRELFPADFSSLSTSTITPLVSQICSYINTNLQNPDLSLKYICDHVLFMNSDYVSKRFQKEMGLHFSIYLNNARISSAKQLLQKNPYEKITVVAAAVGCGNNPQYFSKLFKKMTGISPSDFAAEAAKSF